MARHPHAKLGAGMGAGLLTIIGVSGLPSDLESWGAAFQAIGSDLGRWVLVVVGVGVCVALAASRKRQHAPAGESNGLGPAERREQLDNLFYPPRDDRLELGEQCASFALKMRIFNEEQEWRREKTVARAAKEIREVDPDLDPLQARKDAESHFARNVEAAYALEVRDEALRLFDEAREQGAIAAKARRIAERPLAVEMGEVPNLFVAMARRLGHEPITEYPRASEAPPVDLADQLDSFMREGIHLVAEFSGSVEPQPVKGGWKLEGGDAPDEWWEKADDFARRIRALLIERHPALLADYRDGYNAHVRKERKENEERKPEQDKRSTPEKMLDLANFERSGPKRVVEASIEGLAAARHRIGAAVPQAI